MLYTLYTLALIWYNRSTIYTCYACATNLLWFTKTVFLFFPVYNLLSWLVGPLFGSV